MNFVIARVMNSDLLGENPVHVDMKTTTFA